MQYALIYTYFFCVVCAQVTQELLTVEVGGQKKAGTDKKASSRGRYKCSLCGAFKVRLSPTTEFFDDTTSDFITMIIIIINHPSHSSLFFFCTDQSRVRAGARQTDVLRRHPEYSRLGGNIAEHQRCSSQMRVRYDGWKYLSRRFM